MKGIHHFTQSSRDIGKYVELVKGRATSSSVFLFNYLVHNSNHLWLARTMVTYMREVFEKKILLQTSGGLLHSQKTGV